MTTISHDLDTALLETIHIAHGRPQAQYTDVDVGYFHMYLSINYRYVPLILRDR